MIARRARKTGWCVVLITSLAAPTAGVAQGKGTDPVEAATKTSVEKANTLVSKKSPRDCWDYLSIVFGPAAGLIAAAVATLGIRSGMRQWRITYYTKEWSSLVEFLQGHAEYMDPSKTVDYKAHFTDSKAVAYELIARRCIGYLDDLYYLAGDSTFRLFTGGDDIDELFPGSIKLLGERHEAWLRDNEASYGPKFFKFVTEKIGELRRRESGSVA